MVSVKFLTNKTCSLLFLFYAVNCFSSQLGIQLFKNYNLFIDPLKFLFSLDDFSSPAS